MGEFWQAELTIAETELVYQVQRMIKGNRQHIVLDRLSNFKMGKILCFGEPLVHMITPQVALNCLIYCPPSEN